MGILDDVVINANSAAEAVERRPARLWTSPSCVSAWLRSTRKSANATRPWASMCMKAAVRSWPRDAESVGKMAEIDELVNQRNALTKELVDKQNKVVCPSCGKQESHYGLVLQQLRRQADQ